MSVRSCLPVRFSRLADERGQVLPLVAAALLALLLTLGLVVDGGNGFQNKQSVQNAADAAAFAAAQAVADANYYCNASDPDINSAVADCAGRYAGLNGVSGASGNVTTTTNGVPAAPLPPCSNLPHPQPPVSDTQPPISSNAPGCYVYPYNGHAGQVEVWLTRHTSNFFGKLLGIGASTETARAVASLQAGGPAPPFSFVTLQSDGENHTLLINNTSQLNVDNSLYDDSCAAIQVGCQYVAGGQGNAHDSFDINEGSGSGGALLDKKDEFVVGGWENKGGGAVGANGQICPLTPAQQSAGVNAPATGTAGGGPCPTVGMPYLPDPFALLPQPTPGDPPPGGVGMSTFTVTQKAAAHGIATLTADNNLQSGDLITVSGVDSNFNGFYAVSSASATQISYSDPNLPATTTISPTAVVMNGGVATVTVANNLAVNDNVTVNFGNVNYDGQYTLTTNPTANNFTYLPAVPVPVVSGSITGGVATLSKSGPAGMGIPTGAGNSVTVTTGDEAYDGTNLTVNSTGTAATSFTYTPPKIANVSWKVNSPTSATFTTTGKHDANITSITIAGANAALNNTFNGATLSVGSNTFTVTGSGFSTTAAYPSAVTLNAAITAATSSVPIKWAGAMGAADPVSIGDVIQVVQGGTEDMFVTAITPVSATTATLSVTRGYFGTTAVAHAINAAVTKVSLPTGNNANITVNTTTSTTFSPSFPNAIETAVKIASIANPGTVTVPYFLAATPVTPNGTVTVARSPTPTNPFPSTSGPFSPGTYYGGICLGSSNGIDCAGNHCALGGGSATTVTLSPGTYIMAGGGFQVCGKVTLSARNVLIYSTNDPSAPTATYGKVGQVELNTTGSVTLGPQTVAQDSLYAGFTIWEDRNQVVVPPSDFTPSNYGQKYQLVSGITADNRVFDVKPTVVASCSSATQANKAPNCIAAGNLIQIGSEMMMVTLVTPDGTNQKITVTRGYYQTSQATHSATAVVQSVNQGTDGSHPTCGGKAGHPSMFDIAFLNAGTAPGASGPLSTISGTIYAAGPRADYENDLLGVANLAVIASCVFINSGAVPAGSPTSEFNFQSNGGDGLAGILPQLSG